MIDQTTAIALLFKRAVLATFDDEDASPRVRVNCLERHEISALVALLKEWRPAGGQMVRVAVTARSPWAGLAESDIVPNLGESPTTLRNARGMWVILIEGDDYTDKQGWANVLQISDRNLLDSDEARRELAALFLGSEPPRVLIDVLEEVYAILGSEDEGHVPVRNWVRLVQSAAEALECSALQLIAQPLGVDDHSGVTGDRQPLDVDSSGLAVDGDVGHQRHVGHPFVVAQQREPLPPAARTDMRLPASEIGGSLQDVAGPGVIQVGETVSERILPGVFGELVHEGLDGEHIRERAQRA